jgi:predicted nucleic-acid-binding protein
VLTVDTTVVVRLVTNDDPRQAKRAAALFSAHAIGIPLTVVMETEWVLRHAYKLGPHAIARSLRGLLGLPNVTVAQPLEVQRALQLYEQGLDFADALHLAAANGTQGFKTFDERLCECARAAGLRGISLV